jgi:spore coat protein U-like protein
MKKIKLALLSLGLAMNLGAYAGEVSNNMQVSADVVPVCKIMDETIDFGHYNANNSSLNMVSANLHVTCSETVSYSIVVDPLDGVLLPTNPILASNSNSRLVFVLGHTDLTTEWNLSNPLVNIADGNEQLVPFVAVLEPGKYVEAGSYGRTLVMTVLY